jgi:hypothetical protein
MFRIVCVVAFISSRVPEEPSPTEVLIGYAYAGQAAAFAVFAVAHVLGATTVALLGTETRGKVLEEISKE